MTNKHHLEKEVEKLKVENKKLKLVLERAKIWMEREVKQNVIKIARTKLSRLSSETRDNFFNDNVEDIITVKISDFFGEIILLNIPSSVIDNIISAEINYYHLRENPIADGMSVISSYHKWLDILVEQYITKWFRKFCKKQWFNILRKNNVLEKSLNSVINKWYILSLWRLFHIMRILKKDNEEYYDYVRAFEKYLDKYTYIRDVLLEDDFFAKMEELVNSEMLWSKRHKWKINFVEAREARNLIIWDFKDKDCLMYKLVEMHGINF